MAKIIGCKVFTAEVEKNVTDDVIGKNITEWMRKNPFLMIEHRDVVQNDKYLSVMIMYSGKPGGANPLDG